MNITPRFLAPADNSCGPFSPGPVASPQPPGAPPHQTRTASCPATIGQTLAVAQQNQVCTSSIKPYLHYLGWPQPLPFVCYNINFVSCKAVLLLTHHSYYLGRCIVLIIIIIIATLIIWSIFNLWFRYTVRNWPTLPSLTVVTMKTNLVRFLCWPIRIVVADMEMLYYILYRWTLEHRC